MRLAVVSTPRSGNTWVRILVSFLFQVPHLSADSPDEVDWSRLPESCSLQVHWNRTPQFRKLLANHGFKVASLARHPLDVVVSILHFAQHEVTHWLDLDASEERSLYGARPTSPAFVDYASGPRAARLLSVTTEWWGAGALDVHRLRYEDLVTDPYQEAQRLCLFLGDEPVVRVRDAVNAARIERLRPLVTNRHFWQGRPGLWRLVVTADSARQIARSHSEVFERLGYECDPDPTLSAAGAEENWRALLEAPASSMFVPG